MITFKSNLSVLLPSQKNSYKYTLQIIADILSYDSSYKALQKKMESDLIDWDQFVYVSSDYLVLTTCYCRLKEKGLLTHLPEELQIYLDVITTINRNRNKTIISEIEQIAEVLNANQINHVFVKGSAYLLKNLYQDLGERMLGDIDLLVEESQIHDCYQHLIDYGYTGASLGLTARHFDFKHLPKLKSDEKLAAIEVHKKVLSNSYQGMLNPLNILENKAFVRNTFVPSKEHLLQHTILNFQVNDLGYNYNRISYKAIYDLLRLKENDMFDLSPYSNDKIFRNFFSISKVFFNDFDRYTLGSNKNSLFILKLKYPLLRKILDNLITKYRYVKVILTSRIWAFITNKNYRTEVIQEKRGILR